MLDEHCSAERFVVRAAAGLRMARLLDAADVRAVVTPEAAIRAVRAALVQLAAGRVVTPAPLSLRVPEHDGELHAKAPTSPARSSSW